MTRTRNFSVILLCVGSIAAGGTLRLATRPSVDELQEQAVLAWNSGDVAAAESLSRQALGRSLDADAARNVLVQVAAHDGNPLLQVAALASTPADHPQALTAQLQAGEAAYAAGYAAVAERCWQTALELDPGNRTANGRLIGLAGVRLNPPRIEELILDAAQHGTATAEDLRILLGAEALTREAGSLEPMLRRFIEADPNDEASRLGLARCLLVLHRPDEAADVLRSASSTPEVRIARCAAQLAAGDDHPFAALPELPPDDNRAEYWRLVAERALAQNEMTDAAAALAKAVELRPLNRALRARYSEVLRKLGDRANNRQQAEALEAIQEIHGLVSDPRVQWDQGLIERLIAACERAGATRHLQLLRRYGAK